MKYGVVGASGTLGQVTVRQLLARPESTAINALVRRPDRGLDALDRCETYVGGIFDDAQLDRCIADSDVIINLAARNPADEKLDRENGRDFFLVNGVGAATVAAAAARHRKPLLHFSSVAVYETGTGDDNGLFTEDDVLPAGNQEVCDWWADLLAGLQPLLRRDRAASGNATPTDFLHSYFDERPLPAAAPVYGMSKLLGETLALDIADLAMAIRMSDVYGPGHESRGVVTDHLQALAAEASVTVDFGFRSNIYFVYIDDVSELIARGADRFRSPGDLPRIVNFLGERVDETRFADVLRQLAGDGDVGVRDSGARSAGIDRRYGSTLFDRLYGDFKFTSFADGLSKTFSR